MIESALLRQIISANRNRICPIKLFSRHFDDDALDCCLYVGGRQTGKTYALYQKIQTLLKSGIDLDDIVYVNFADPRLCDFVVTDFEHLLEAQYFLSHTKNPPTLFFDEVQRVKDWEQFVCRMAKNNIAVYATDSTVDYAYKPSKTIEKKFRVISIFPLSLKERLMIQGVAFDTSAQNNSTQRGLLTRAFAEHLNDGGFPRAMLAPDPNSLVSIFNDSYYGNLLRRDKVAIPQAFFSVIKTIAQCVGCALSFTKLARIVEDNGIHIAKTTVIGYVEHARDTFLLFPIKNFAGKSGIKESVPKYYFIDSGFLTLLNVPSIQARLENTIALALLKRYGLRNQVFFWKKNIEVDFCIPQDELAIQVCRKLGADPQTKEREIKALVKLSQVAPCKRLLVLTEEEEDTVTTDGLTIEILPAWKWLLNEI